MIQKTWTFLLLALIICNWSYAQSKKKIRKNQVDSKTEWTYIYNKGKEQAYKSAYVNYDKRGNILKEITYKPDGTIKKKETFKYDESGDKIEEIRYDTDGNVKKKIVYKYDDNGLRAVREEYDGKGVLLERQISKYEFAE